MGLRIGHELRTKEIIDGVETVGRRIERLREEKGISQRQLAEGLYRVSYAFISRIESGDREPSLRTLRLLAERLGVTGRSVRRDVERLRDLGYPVHASKGHGGGYQLGAGAALPSGTTAAEA